MSQVTSEQVSDGLYMLVGKGGNIGVSIGDDGTFMIDDKFADMSPAIQDAITGLGGDTPRFLVNTHFHGDHSGGNENFGNAGSTIVAHHNVHKRLSEGSTIAAFNMTSPPAPEAALPVISFESNMTFHLNGDHVQVIHVPNAHTDGDAFVHFTGANVIHTGDLFFNGFFPFIDVPNGGSVPGVIAAINQMLELANDDTVIIPGHGPIAGVGELTAYRDMLVTANDRLGELRAQGFTGAEAAAKTPLADLDEQWGKAMFSAEKWITIIYDGVGE